MAEICDACCFLLKGFGHCCETFASAGSILYPSDCRCPWDTTVQYRAKKEPNMNGNLVPPSSMHVDRMLLQTDNRNRCATS